MSRLVFDFVGKKRGDGAYRRPNKGGFKGESRRNAEKDAGSVYQQLILYLHLLQALRKETSGERHNTGGIMALCRGWSVCQQKFWWQRKQLACNGVRCIN